MVPTISGGDIEQVEARDNGCADQAQGRDQRQDDHEPAPLEQVAERQEEQKSGRVPDLGAVTMRPAAPAPASKVRRIVGSNGWT